VGNQGGSKWFSGEIIKASAASYGIRCHLDFHARLAFFHADLSEARAWLFKQDT
jgi:hypothetical protein